MVHPKEINARINELVAASHASFYIELVAKSVKRQPKPKIHTQEGSLDGHSAGPDTQGLTSHAEQHEQAQLVSTSILSQSLDQGH